MDPRNTNSGTEKELEQVEKLQESSKEDGLEEAEVQEETHDELQEATEAENDPERSPAPDRVVATTAEQLPPLDFSWIHSGCKLIVKVGRQEIPYAAICQSAPFSVVSNGCWMVKVKWDGWSQKCMETVECSSCERIDLTETSMRRSSRNLVVATPKVSSRSKWLQSPGQRALPTTKPTSDGACGKRGRCLFPSEHDKDEDDDSAFPAETAAIVVTPERVVEPFARAPSSDSDFLDTDSSESNNGQGRMKAARLGLMTVVARPYRAARATATKNQDEGDSIGGYDEDGEDEDEDEDICKPAAISSDTEASQSINGKGNGERQERQYEKAKRSLCALPGMSEQEVVAALEKVGLPYGLQSVMQEINAQRDNQAWVEPKLFVPSVGMRVRKFFNGRNYHGTVTKDAEMVRQDDNGKPGEEVMMWQVQFDDDDIHDMPFDELLRCRADRPRMPAPGRGRQLQMLEIFSGQGIVTQEFCDLKWKVASIDSSPDSNATIRRDIENIKPEELPFVPDFIWFSPPCQTYTRLAGGRHRSLKNGELEKSQESRDHNFIFTKMAEIMYWCKKKAPHLIVAIENPVGSLKGMPLMIDLTKNFGLFETQVHYCAFGRDEMKPTMIWTNDIGLKATLSQFTCANKCPHKGQAHPASVRRDGGRLDFAVIPQMLAEEVAEYVQGKFNQDRVRDRKAALPDEP